MKLKQNTLERKQSRFSGLLNKIVETLENRLRTRSIKRLKKGLSHENRKYCGFIGSMKYGINNILNGRAEQPTDWYEIGRYMAIAKSLVKFGAENSDVDAALTGAQIYGWLGQGHRQSVRNKVKKAYNGAKKISKQYDIPLSVCNDRTIALISSDLKRGMDDYLERNPPLQIRR